MENPSLKLCTSGSLFKKIYYENGFIHYIINYKNTYIFN